MHGNECAREHSPTDERFARANRQISTAYRVYKFMSTGWRNWGSEIFDRDSWPRVYSVVDGVYFPVVTPEMHTIHNATEARAHTHTHRHSMERNGKYRMKNMFINSNSASDCRTPIKWSNITQKTRMEMLNENEHFSRKMNSAASRNIHFSLFRFAIRWLPSAIDSSLKLSLRQTNEIKHFVVRTHWLTHSLSAYLTPSLVGSAPRPQKNEEKNEEKTAKKFHQTNGFT